MFLNLLTHSFSSLSLFFYSCFFFSFSYYFFFYKVSLFLLRLIISLHSLSLIHSFFHLLLVIFLIYLYLPFFMMVSQYMKIPTTFNGKFFIILYLIISLPQANVVVYTDVVYNILHIFSLHIQIRTQLHTRTRIITPTRQHTDII